MNKFERIKTSPCFRESLEYLKQEYERYADMSIPELTRELFDYFYETGSRKEYENEYFKRRGALLTSAVMAFIYGEREYINSLVEIVDAICDEFTWALPAHVKKNNPNPERVIDLFAAETGETLSEVYVELGDKLPSRVRTRIKSELERRIVKPFIEERFGWEHFTHNWAAVCGGAVGVTFINMFAGQFPYVEERINNTMQSYISGFGGDGITPEGMGYWIYGFWYFTGYADLYKRRFGVDIISNEKIKNIAMCQQNLFLKDNNVISFSDTERFADFELGLAHYYRKIFGGEIKLLTNKVLVKPDNCYRFLSYIRGLEWIDEELLGICDVTEKEQYFEDVQWYVNRGEGIAFSAKGGNNGENHNHNDIGAFILCTDCGQIIADYGCGEYTHDYFNEKRYEYLCNSSRGHSVPIIDGKLQMCGREFSSNVTRHSDGVFALEFADAYDKAAKSIKRTFVIREASVEMRDEFTFDDKAEHNIAERFVSLIKPEAVGNEVRIGNVTLVCEATPVISSEMLKSHNCEDEILYFTDYPSGNIFDITFVIGK